MQARPYTEYETLPMWEVVDAAISELVVNRDLTETTDRHYIVGLIVKRLAEAGLSTTQPPTK